MEEKVIKKIIKEHKRLKWLKEHFGWIFYGELVNKKTLKQLYGINGN